ncbi:hypothetical protein FB382_001706 [Nocardioides ginsengisegetis]|uniref:Uncharacterized protein n=1 Tax=Nocardioides ginsengisegetis TaxID=661491 RepID=A0A7W3P982_9ACTN|nr:MULTISPECIES: hypothetical protein [Nocardioides]MBA8803415.1 hypothetical protein [Nocardioides ginsengisegetis]GCD89057.1 hypothetical protein NLS1_10630 [Nocardioides sp. LS1]
MHIRRSPAIVLSLVLSAAALSIAPGAVASDGGTAKDVDSCSGPSTYKLKVTPDDDGHLQVVGVVWSDDNDVWSWRLKHNGDVSYTGDVKAKDADLSFRVVRTMVDLAGPDTVVFRAENDDTGEVCRGEVDL